MPEDLCLVCVLYATINVKTTPCKTAEKRGNNLKHPTPSSIYMYAYTLKIDCNPFVIRANASSIYQGEVCKLLGTSFLQARPCVCRDWIANLTFHHNLQVHWVFLFSGVFRAYWCKHFVVQKLGSEGREDPAIPSPIRKVQCAQGEVGCILLTRLLVHPQKVIINSKLQRSADARPGIFPRVKTRQNMRSRENGRNCHPTPLPIEEELFFTPALLTQGIILSIIFRAPPRGTFEHGNWELTYTCHGRRALARFRNAAWTKWSILMMNKWYKMCLHVLYVYVYMHVNSLPNKKSYHRCKFRTDWIILSSW